MYIIETNRLGLREWIDTDIPKFAEVNKDPRVMEYFPKKLSEEETKEMVNRIKKHFDDNGYGFFAVEIKDTNEFIGFTGLSIPRFQVDFTPCIRASGDCIIYFCFEYKVNECYAKDRYGIC